RDRVAVPEADAVYRARIEVMVHGDRTDPAIGPVVDRIHASLPRAVRMDDLPWRRTVRDRDDGTRHAHGGGPAPERIGRIRTGDGGGFVGRREVGRVHRQVHGHGFEEGL